MVARSSTARLAAVRASAVEMERSTRPRVFVTRQLPGDALARLAAQVSLHVWEEPLPPPRKVLLDQAREVDGLITLLTDRIDEPLLSQAPGLRAVSNVAVGYDNIDVGACTARRIPVGNTPGVLTETRTRPRCWPSRTSSRCTCRSTPAPGTGWGGRSSRR